MSEEAKKINEKPPKGELINIEIDKAKKAGMNLLLPSIHMEGLSEFHSPVLDYCELSPEISDGDVYFHSESKKLVPSKQGLMKLAMCAGIMWDMSRTGRTDDRKSRDYVSYSACGAVRRIDGTLVHFPAEYDMDFAVIEEKLRDQYTKKGKAAKKTGDELHGYIDYCVKRDLLYKREHKLKICESGAMTRVIRSLLGLKAGYTTKELAKPFVVARITFRPDYSDPEIRKIMVKKSIESITNIYGGVDDVSEQLSSPAIEIPHDSEDVIDANLPEDEQDFNEPDPETPDNLTNEKADFLASDSQTKLTILETMAKRAGYDLGQIKKPLKQFTEDELEGFFDKLDALLDIPF